MKKMPKKNAAAISLRSPLFRMKIVRSRKAYNRKKDVDKPD
jgi:stalled ribosome alternative rescue factor ArfA